MTILKVQANGSFLAKEKGGGVGRREEATVPGQNARLVRNSPMISPGDRDLCKESLNDVTPAKLALRGPTQPQPGTDMVPPEK